MASDPGSTPMGDPLAFFLTWTTYGSWLPGDERRWVEKPGRFREANADRKQDARKRMSDPELTLIVAQREIVEKTVADHCRIRGWNLHAVNCRTQHVHVVVTAPNRDPEEVMDQLKAWCTRRLKEHAMLEPESHVAVREKWWTQGGSKRRLYNEASMEAAIQYVLEGQDGPFIDPI